MAAFFVLFHFRKCTARSLKNRPVSNRVALFDRLTVTALFFLHISYEIFSCIVCWVEL
jgi:hypothetical protein